MLENKSTRFVYMPTSPGSGFYGEASFDCQLADDNYRIIQCYIFIMINFFQVV